MVSYHPLHFCCQHQPGCNHYWARSSAGSVSRWKQGTWDRIPGKEQGRCLSSKSQMCTCTVHLPEVSEGGHCPSCCHQGHLQGLCRAGMEQATCTSQNAPESNTASLGQPSHQILFQPAPKLNLVRGWSQVGMGLFSQTSYRTRENRAPSCAGRLDISKNFVVRYWKGLPRDVMEFPSLEVSREMHSVLWPG